VLGAGCHLQEQQGSDHVLDAWCNIALVGSPRAPRSSKEVCST
jgi:hypothetical protein